MNLKQVCEQVSIRFLVIRSYSELNTCIHITQIQLQWQHSTGLEAFFASLQRSTINFFFFFFFTSTWTYFKPLSRKISDSPFKFQIYKVNSRFTDIFFLFVVYIMLGYARLFASTTTLILLLMNTYTSHYCKPQIAL